MELNKLTIKKMETNDLDEVLDMEASSSLNPWSNNMFAEEMKNPCAYCFIIQMKGTSKHQVMGFICFRNIGDESELLNICVHPQYRQMGIGKKLMQFYIGFCRKMKIKTFYLEVNALNQSAVHLYQHFSYQSLGMRRKFYQGKFDALLMTKKA
jgi:[ribosomal protein S18]-alanine N-acetyltransferase